MQPNRVTPKANQESVWDYPRPPVVRLCAARVRVVHGGVTVADTTTAHKVCETSQLPAYYLPRADIAIGVLHVSERRSLCEWKGLATYWTLAAPGRAPVTDVAWSYEDPTAPFASIAGHVAFCAARLDECWVGDERARPNLGDFYGGWWTPDVVGPFKGGPGSSWW